jgi:hypothetical protein
MVHFPNVETKWDSCHGDCIAFWYDGVEGTISITVEEMARVTENGGEYLSPVQEELVLIPYPR